MAAPENPDRKIARKYKVNIATYWKIRKTLDKSEDIEPAIQKYKIEKATALFRNIAIRIVAKNLNKASSSVRYRYIHNKSDTTRLVKKEVLTLEARFGIDGFDAAKAVYAQRRGRVGHSADPRNRWTKPIKPGFYDVHMPKLEDRKTYYK